MKLPVSRDLALLARYLRPQWPRVAALAFLLSGSIALQLYQPQILRRFLDTAGAGGQSRSLLWLALLFILLALVNQLLTVLARYLGEQVSWTATNELRADLAAHCLKLDLSFHKSRTPGEMVERIDTDVAALSNFFSRMIIDVLANGVLMVGILAALLREDWRAGLALGLFAAITLWAMGWIRARSVPLWAEERQTAAEFYGYLGEVLSGTEAIRSSGAADYVLYRFRQLMQRLFRAVLRSGMTFSVMWGSSYFLFALGSAIAFSLGAWLYSAGAISAGTVYLLFHYTEMLRRPMEQIRTQLQDLQRAGAAIDRVEALLQTTSRIVDGPGVPIPDGPLAVAFEQVTFEYDPGDPVLQGVTFRLQPGQVLGLLGRTGSGKSTLARLLLRFYDPVDGAVLVGGVNLKEAKVAELRRRVGFVSQDVQLFAASVRENVTLFDPSIPDERIIAVLDDLGLGPWVRSLPRGLDTELESGSTALSAGEAQLLAFARVFLRDPGLVILDEASSRLDPATEVLVERAVTRLLAGRTGIIIAHRLATVQRADAILILEDGRVVEHGERTALAADPDSRFARPLMTGLEEVLA